MTKRLGSNPSQSCCRQKYAREAGLTPGMSLDILTGFDFELMRGISPRDPAASRLNRQNGLAEKRHQKKMFSGSALDNSCFLKLDRSSAPSSNMQANKKSD